MAKETLGGFQSRIEYNLGYVTGDDPTLDSRVKGWVNEAIQIIWEDTWHLWAPVLVTGTLTADIGTWPMPTAARAPLKNVWHLKEGGNWRMLPGPIVKYKIKQYMPNVEGSDGPPRRMWLDYYDQSNDYWVMAFHPVPTQAYTIRGQYWKRAQELTNVTSALEGPPELTPLVVDYGLYRAHESLSHGNISPAAETHLARFDRGFERLMSVLRPEHQGEQFDYADEVFAFSDINRSSLSTRNPLDL